VKAALLAIAVCAALAGCSARTQVSANSNTSAGTSVTSGSAGLQVQGGSNSLAAAIIAISLLAGAIDYSRDPRPFPGPSALLPGPAERAPQLAPDRRVNEQDCTRPVDFSAGNLRCK
jgi:hypothetical protein